MDLINQGLTALLPAHVPEEVVRFVDKAQLALYQRGKNRLIRRFQTLHKKSNGFIETLDGSGQDKVGATSERQHIPWVKNL